MAPGFSATLSAKKLQGVIPRPLEIDRVLNEQEGLRHEEFGIPDLAVRTGIRAATRPTFTVSYLPENSAPVIDFGGAARFRSAVSTQGLSESVRSSRAAGDRRRRPPRGSPLPDRRIPEIPAVSDLRAAGTEQNGAPALADSAYYHVGSTHGTGRLGAFSRRTVPICRTGSRVEPRSVLPPS